MVLWGARSQDFHGRELVTVREFEPSENGEADEKEQDYPRKTPCCCIS